MRDHLIVLSASHEHVPLAVRERLAVPEAALAGVLARKTPGIKELAVLSTCNRTEYYAVVAAGQCPARTLAAYVCAVTGLDRAELDQVGRVHLDGEAVRHLLRVASGLESMVPGEPHILGQVRSAFAGARAGGACGPVLGRLGQDALTTGKRVRSETGLARTRATIPHVAVDVAARRLGPLAGKTAVVVGAGEMGVLAAQVLRGAGAGRLIIVNRSAERGRALAERVGGEFRGIDELAAAIGEADLVMAATGGDRCLIDPTMFTGERGNEPGTVVIDLGVPRQVAPGVAAVPGVTLLDVDALAPVAAERRQETAREAAAAERLVDAAGGAFLSWWAQRAAAPTIAALRDRADQVREKELDRALRKLAHLSARDRNVVAALAAGIANKLLHEPTARLRDDRDGELAAAARALFDLDDVDGVTDGRADVPLRFTHVAADDEAIGVA